MTLTFDQRRFILQLSCRYMQDRGHTQEAKWVEPTFRTMEERGLLDGGHLRFSRGSFPTEDSDIGNVEPYLSQLVIGVIIVLIMEAGKYGLRSLITRLRDHRQRHKFNRRLGLRTKEVCTIADDVYSWFIEVDMDFPFVDPTETAESEK